MSVRSLPHFSHSAIGKTTHKRGVAYQYVNYITREEACSKVLAANMPASREDGARAYFDGEAYKDGVAANARIADTFIIALPIELTAEQRHEAVAGFMDKIGKGRIAWMAAFHDMGEDAHNPHCHLILRDADVDTGRKVIGTTTSAKDVREAEAHGWKVPPRMTTRDLRHAWCEHLNGEMERHGYEARFDQRSLKEQGIDREPGIHVGPQAQAMAEKGKRFESQDRLRGDHANVYSLLDDGSRAEHNARIREANRAREAGKNNPQAKPGGQEGLEKLRLRARQAAERKDLYAEQSRDRAALRAAHEEQKLAHQRWSRKLYAQARQTAFEQVKSGFAGAWKEVWRTTDKQQKELAQAALKAQQQAAYAEASTKEIAKAQPEKNAAWQDLKSTQDTERQHLKQHHLEETAALSRQHIAERHALHEHWQQQHRQRETARVSARLQNSQGMAPTQATAVAMIRQQARERAAQDPTGQLASAANAAWQFNERARAAGEARKTIRYDLDALRRVNEARAGPRARQRMAGAHAAGQRYVAQQKAHQPQRDERQDAARQALATGRALTSEERAGASGDVREAVAARDKQSRRQRRERAFEEFVTRDNAEKAGRDRGGGRSGR